MQFTIKVANAAERPSLHGQPEVHLVRSPPLPTTHVSVNKLKAVHAACHPGAGFTAPTLFEIAAAYAFHIAQNQPFVDGNKRAGLGAALLFLRLNEFQVEDPEQALYEAMLAIAERRLDKVGLAALIERLSSPVGEGGQRPPGRTRSHPPS